MTSNEKAKLRAELAAELDFYPASVDPESVARHPVDRIVEREANHQGTTLYATDRTCRHNSLALTTVAAVHVPEDACCDKPPFTGHSYGTGMCESPGQG
jgi:hypothetical protein